MSFICITPHPLTSDLVKLQDDLDALMEEASLADQASAIQGHQFLVKIDGEYVQVDPSIQTHGFPQCHRAQRTSCKFMTNEKEANERRKSSLIIQLVAERILNINFAYKSV